MNLLQITTLKNPSADAVTIMTKDKFKALWMTSGAYISLTKELSELLAKEKVEKLTPYKVNLSTLPAKVETFSSKEFKQIPCSLVANKKGFPILNVADESVKVTPFAVSIELADAERLEKVFIHDNVKLRFYRVDDKKQNLASFLFEVTEDFDRLNGLFTFSVSENGKTKFVYELSIDKFSPNTNMPSMYLTKSEVPESYAVRSKDSHLRLKVDYLIPRETVADTFNSVTPNVNAAKLEKKFNKKPNSNRQHKPASGKAVGRK